MILKKIIIDDKEVYEQISLDEALALEDKNILVFTDENEEDDFYDHLKDHKKDGEDEKEEDFFPHKKWSDKNSKIISRLPFLKDEEIHKMVEPILKGDKSFKDLPVMAMMPFLSEEDRDALFMKAVEEQNKDYVAFAVFVSDSCLSKLVDAYLEGKYPNLLLDELYLFMSSENIKRIFNHFLEKRKKTAKE